MQHEIEHQYTLEEYWRLVEAFPEHKYEYVDGFLRMMARGTLHMLSLATV